MKETSFPLPSILKSREGGLLIESDVVGEEGVIVADGPSLELHGDLSAPSVQVRIDEWFESFDRLSWRKFTDIETAIKKLDKVGFVTMVMLQRVMLL